ncbi:YggS family pyridoxal phosphate-dependent enzyme [Ferruginibacter albus]|uniref:YggS family pyridoxal phosphate-dependent enzyme n=1 Tax=Ferruginibacter albus TaxID=2875540 RepID=UPI001CC5351E|nr:YggS family pyridoxal phosphate-dependent enzyme [Ferruginibacter albus]UAY52929.1 YggS family pyridoxal phosphate-dependent enzyme [Ferruginibacter albus]
MSINLEKYNQIKEELEGKATLVAVSKTKPVEDIKALYDLGHRDFGENYVQELVDKQAQLPKDIRWHFIGHLQSNKVKFIAPFIHLIHAIDSISLLKEIDKQAEKANRIIDLLLQVYIAKEETKFGLSDHELQAIIPQLPAFKNVSVKGLMGMASFTNDMRKARAEFHHLKNLYHTLTIHDSRFTILSMGMSSDYHEALHEGTNMVRIGSLLFGEREYQK